MTPEQRDRPPPDHAGRGRGVGLGGPGEHNRGSLCLRPRAFALASPQNASAN